MKIFLKRAFLTFAAASLCASAALAQDSTNKGRDDSAQDGRPSPEGREGRHGRRRGWRRGRQEFRGPALRGLREIDLTDAQREQMRAMRERYKDANRAEREELRALWRLRKEGTPLTPEQQARTRVLIDALSQTGRNIEREMMSVLTPEQQTRLQQMQEERRKLREERRRLRRERREAQPRDERP